MCKLKSFKAVMKLSKTLTVEADFEEFIGTVIAAMCSLFILNNSFYLAVKKKKQQPC